MHKRTSCSLSIISFLRLTKWDARVKALSDRAHVAPGLNHYNIYSICIVRAGPWGTGLTELSRESAGFHLCHNVVQVKAGI